MKHVWVAILICLTMPNSYAGSLEIQRNQKDKITQITFPSGDVMTYLWKNGKLIQRKFSPYQSEQTFTYPTNNDEAAKQIIKTNYERFGWTMLHVLLKKEEETNPSNAIKLANEIWKRVIAEQIWWNKMATNQLPPTSDAVYITQDEHQKEWDFFLKTIKTNKPTASQFYLYSYLSYLKILKSKADFAKQHLPTIEVASSEWMTQKAAQLTQKTIDYIKTCNETVSNQLQKLLSEKQMKLSINANIKLNQLRQMKTATLDELGLKEMHFYMVPRENRSTIYFQESWLALIGSFNGNMDTFLKNVTDKPNTAALYYSDENFQIDTLINNPTIYAAQELVHELGHIYQHEFQNPDIHNFQGFDQFIGEILSERKIVLSDPKIIEKMLNSQHQLEALVESSATFYSLDSLITCL